MDEGPQTSVIYCGDCLDELKRLPDGSIDLVYLDPPFNSNRNYEVFWGDTREQRAFDDRFGDAQAYCEYMFPRIAELYRVLKKTGSLYYHCDWHASHYIKVKILDTIFGFNNFVNEIIWKRADAHSDARQGSKHYGRIADSLFYYVKGSSYTFNTLYKPLSDSTSSKWYRHVEAETGRMYNMADLTAAKPGGDTLYEFKGVKPPPGRYWAYSREKMEEFDRQGRIVLAKSGKPYYKRYLDESKGVPLQCLWDDVSQLRGFDPKKERLGYPTQKPLALLERIINVSSNEGDIVLDPFCGCGTALVASQKLGRKWIGIDIAPSACRVMGARLEHDCGLKAVRDFTIVNLPITEERLHALPHFEFQEWCVIALSQGIPGSTSVVSAAMSGDMGIDGKLYLVDRVSLEAGATKVKKLKTGEQVLAFDPLENYIPIQVKQKETVGRPDIDSFFAAVKRDKRKRGFFAAFSFADNARKECERLWLEEKVMIQCVTVKQLIDRDFRKELEYVRMIGG